MQFPTRLEKMWRRRNFRHRRSGLPPAPLLVTEKLSGKWNFLRCIIVLAILIKKVLNLLHETSSFTRRDFPMRNRGKVLLNCRPHPHALWTCNLDCRWIMWRVFFLILFSVKSKPSLMKLKERAGQSWRWCDLLAWLMIISAAKGERGRHELFNIMNIYDLIRFSSKRKWFFYILACSSMENSAELLDAKDFAIYAERATAVLQLSVMDHCQKVLCGRE